MNKKIKVGKFSFEKSENSFGYHLYEDCEITNKDTGIKRIEPKIKGYDMTIKSIVNIMAEDKAFDNSETILGFLNRIDFTLKQVELSIKEQL